GKAESGDIGPAFVEWIRQQLDEQFGKQLYEQGLKVYTTLDLDMQSAAERALERQLRLMEAGKSGSFPHESYEHYEARSLAGSETPDTPPYIQRAPLALAPRHAPLRAIPGGPHPYAPNFNRIPPAPRHPAPPSPPPPHPPPP